MKSYPIWNEVKSCLYKSSKSWGGKDHSDIKINVGSSVQNSHVLGEITTIRKTVATATGHNTPHIEEIHFILKLDGKPLKTMIFNNNKGKAGELKKTITH